MRFAEMVSTGLEMYRYPFFRIVARLACFKSKYLREQGVGGYPFGLLGGT